MDEAPYDPDTQRALHLFVVLSRCFNSVAEHSRQDIEANGLSVSEFAVLEMLHHKGPTPLGEIARKVLLTSGSMTYVIDQLVRKGLVQRVSCARDRRRLYAELTDAGRDRIVAIFPAHAERIRRALDALPPEEQEEAIRLLRQLGRGAQQQLNAG